MLIILNAVYTINDKLLV